MLDITRISGVREQRTNGLAPGDVLPHYKVEAVVGRSESTVLILGETGTGKNSVKKY
jgi:hypothetical protein